MLLDKCLKRPVLEDCSTSNMVVGPKYCCNLKTTPFSKFIDLNGGNSVRKSVS